MRALLDTNILVSFLLTKSDSEGPIPRLIQAAFAGVYTVIVPEEVAAELERGGERPLPTQPAHSAGDD